MVGLQRLCVQDYRSRTNNVLESYHASLRRRIQVSHHVSNAMTTAPTPVFRVCGQSATVWAPTPRHFMKLRMLTATTKMTPVTSQQSSTDQPLPLPLQPSTQPPCLLRVMSASLHPEMAWLCCLMGTRVTHDVCGHCVEAMDNDCPICRSPTASVLSVFA